MYVKIHVCTHAYIHICTYTSALFFRNRYYTCFSSAHWLQLQLRISLCDYWKSTFSLGCKHHEFMKHACKNMHVIFSTIDLLPSTDNDTQQQLNDNLVDEWMGEWIVMSREWHPNISYNKRLSWTNIPASNNLREKWICLLLQFPNRLLN